MSRNQTLILGAAVLVIVAALVAYFVIWPQTGSGGLGQTAEKAGVVITAQDRTLGSPKASVVVVEYAAPSCPHCARFNAEVFPLLKQKYIDSGKIYYVFRVFPINAVDGAAEAMARCLPADNYFQFIDTLFRNQARWDPEYPSVDVHQGLVELGHEAGMSTEQVDKCMADKAQADRINQVSQDAVTRYNISGTPTFVINGVVQPSGEIAWTSLQATLDSFLSKK